MLNFLTTKKRFKHKYKKLENKIPLRGCFLKAEISTPLSRGSVFKKMREL